MGQRSPLVTLAATAVGLVVLLVVNSTQTGGPAPADTAAATQTTAPATTAPATTEPPSASIPPESEPPPATQTAPQNTAVYVGRTAGREATVALAVKGTKAVAYVCDGRQLEAWLTGTVTDGKVVLRSRTGERLQATVTAKTAAGTLTLHGKTLRFAIGPASPPAGLYRGQNSTSTIGWIVLPDGSQVGIDNDGTPGPAPELDPGTGAATVGGTQVTAQPISGDETF